MKRLLLLLALGAAPACGDSEPRPLGGTTRNMRSDNPEDGPDNWRFRRERIAGLYRQHLAVQIIACHLDQDMALVFCLEIVAVDDADRVIELKAMTEAQTRARVKLKHPADLDHDAATGRNKAGLVRAEREALGR